MQGHTAVIDCLKELLRGELAARDQYFIHSRQYEDQGFVRLYERLNHEMQEETEHADAILRRILMLEGKPDMRPHAFTPGESVVDLCQRILNDLANAEASVSLGDNRRVVVASPAYLARKIGRAACRARV